MFPVYTESFEILHILINNFETMYQIIWVPAQIKFESLPDSCNSSNWFECLNKLILNPGTDSFDFFHRLHRFFAQIQKNRFLA